MQEKQIARGILTLTGPRIVVAIPTGQDIWEKLWQTLYLCMVHFISTMASWAATMI